MKRAFLALVCAVMGLGLYAQGPGQGPGGPSPAGPMDIILLLDTSSGTAPSYQQVNNYITGGFLREFVRRGDTFHLITFADAAQLDISRRIEGRGDMEIIIGRMYLHYPLGPQADLPAALDFAEKYAASLPARSKKMAIVSSGISAGHADLIAAVRARLAEQDTDFYPVPVPIASPPVSGRAPIAQPRPAPPPPPTTTESVPEPAPAPIAEAVPEPETEDAPALTQLEQDLLAQELLEQELLAQEQAVQELLHLEQMAHEVLPQGLPDAGEPEAPPAAGGNTAPLLLLLAGLGLLGIIIAAFFIIVIAKYRADRAHSAQLRAPLLLNLYVEDQSPFIGKRNIHALKTGGRLTIGGGDSDFLVFVVTVPPRIAEIRRNGKRCTFVPLKPKYFPDLGSQKLPDCLGKTIRILTDQKYLLRIRVDAELVSKLG